MIDITVKGRNVKVFFNGQGVMDFHKDESPLSLGSGKATYKMNRGTFRFKEKVKKTSLSYVGHKKIEQGYKMVFEDVNQWKVLMVLSEENGRLTITLEGERLEQFNRFYLTLCSPEDEHIYGGGEQFSKLNLKGEKTRIWVSEHVTLASILKKNVALAMGVRNHKIKAYETYTSYMVVPTFLTSKKRYIHVETDAYSAFDFRKATSLTMEIREIPKSIHIGIHKDYEQLMGELTLLTGRQPCMPGWVYDGMIFGIQDGTEACEKKLNRIKAYDGAVAGIWCQDWEGQRMTAFGKQLMWDWKFDQSLYPNLPMSIKKWYKQDINFLGYINPFLALEGELYAEALRNGYLVLDQEGEIYKVKITTFEAAMIDLTNEEACCWIKNIIKINMIGIGMKGWMADFGEYLPTDAVLKGDKTSEAIHNQWPALWSKINREAIEEAGQLGEVFFFSRAGYTGSQRYATLMWNGDQHVDFSRDYGLGSVVTAQLSLSMIGCGLSHSDVGGYTGFGLLRRHKDLLIRWAELSCFSPLMRSHEGNRPMDNWHFDTDEPTLSIICRLSRMHRMLKPYLIHCDEDNHLKGLPMIRPLFFYYDEALAYKSDQSYLLGRDLLVAPVVRANQKKCQVYLPEDRWLHLFTGNIYGGGTYEVESPLGQPTVFARVESTFINLFENIKEA